VKRAGPIFISGRQHSGNTVVAVLLSRVPACFAQIDENSFFEHRRIVDRVRDATARAQRVFQLMRLEYDEARVRTLDHLRNVAEASPGITALELYREGMDFATRCAGKQFWAQKATSYVFYAREILSSMPDARFLYLIRNPYDIVTSRKRRYPDRERIWGTVTSWNKGLRIARSLTAAFPGRVKLLRYEDLTDEPEHAVQDLLGWIGEPFDHSLLDVPHVNRSETRYSLIGDGKGLNRTRVNYYLENLSDAELAGVDFLVDSDLLDSCYGDLPHKSRRLGLRARAAGAALALSGPMRYGIDYARRLRHDPSLLITRTMRRLS
jgi:hypothetical protein